MIRSLLASLAGWCVPDSALRFDVMHPLVYGGGTVGVLTVPRQLTDDELAELRRQFTMRTGIAPSIVVAPRFEHVDERTGREYGEPIILDGPTGIPFGE